MYLFILSISLLTVGEASAFSCRELYSLKDSFLAMRKANKDFFVAIATIKGYEKLDFPVVKSLKNPRGPKEVLRVQIKESLYNNAKDINYYYYPYKLGELAKENTVPIDKEILIYGTKYLFNNKVYLDTPKGTFCHKSQLKFDGKSVKGLIKEKFVKRNKSKKPYRDDKMTLDEFKAFLKKLDGNISTEK